MGSEEAKSVVHKHILCRSSEFFQAAYRGEWREAIDKVVRLPEVDPDTFDLYLGWLYTKQIDLPSVPAAGFRDDEALEQEEDDLLHSLINAYALGDVVADTSFRNAVVDKARDMLIPPHPKRVVLPGFREITELYCRVPRRPKLSRLFVDIWVFYLADGASFAKHLQDIPTDFVAEVASICMEERTMRFADREPTRRSRCFYHEHRNDSDKCN